MSYARRLGLCAVVSAAGHLLLARSSANLPVRAETPRPVVVRVQLTDPPPPPPPEPEPEPEKLPEPRRQPVHVAPNQRAVKVATNVPRVVNPVPVPPSERPSNAPEASGVPVFGISMESTSAAGSGPALPVGNTLQARPRGPVAEPSSVKPLVPVAQAYEVTKMPLPRGACSGQYTEEARSAGLEGVVVFDLVVDETGHARDVKVVQGLGAGLTEAARSALHSCLFTPGERDGKPVPVRVRGFKIRFQLRENE